ncbi:MAG: hypothetical protein JWM05_1067 [Acidimicrobiales bacterium]|nr:hypothetical protein [Acidimicrobiales bacterium]
MRSARRPLVLALAVAALVAGSCSSKGGKAAPTPAELKPALLVASDLPSGYKQGTPSPADNSTFVTTPPACGDAVTAFDKSTANTDVKVSFDSADQTRTIEQSVGGEADVAKKWETFQGILTKECKGMVKIKTKGYTGTLESVDVAALGEGSAALRLTLSGTEKGVAVEVTGYNVYVLRGQTVDSVSLLSVKVPSQSIDGGVIDLAEVVSLAKKADAKIANALG